MKKVSVFLALSFLFFLSTTTIIISQTFDGEWSTAYVTDDDNVNGTNQRTMSVTATGDNNFVALVSRSSNDSYYLVGYRDADSSNGRIGTTYGSGLQTFWAPDFESAIYLKNPMDVASIGDLIFVANNDKDYNILVFELMPDSLYAYPLRMSTIVDAFSPDSLWGIDVSSDGKVYVTTQGDLTSPSKIYIYDSPANEPAWAESHDAAPAQIITLPDNGQARGVSANEDGSVIYVSNYSNGKIYAYVGNISDGYTLSPSFNFEQYEEVDTTGFVAAPWGLTFMEGNNILFAAMDVDFHTGDGYSYGRIYAVNPNSGEILDTIDVAAWNALNNNGNYDNHKGGIASGYASTYNVSYDDQNNIYSQSYYGWTIEKWVYSGTLPTIKLTITDVEIINSNIPDGFEVSQNYPNPFNPSTTIQFAINERAPITLSIYNINGELITKLVNGNEFEAGTYKITFDASRLASGTYIYSISNGSSLITKKMTLLK